MDEVTATIAHHLPSVDGGTLLRIVLQLPIAFYGWILWRRTWNEWVADQVRVYGTGQERHPANAPYPTLVRLQRLFLRSLPKFLPFFLIAFATEIAILLTPEKLLDSRPFAGLF
jgi:hypothetical protein